MSRRDEPSGGQIALPHLTPLVKGMLIGLGIVFVAQLLIDKWLLPPTSEYTVENITALFPSRVMRGQVWRLITYPIAQVPDLTSLLWGAMSIYFFGTGLEESLGTRRFALFLGLSVVFPAIIAVLASMFHPSYLNQPFYGIGTLGFALTAAWGTRFPNARLAFPPVTGRILVWITLALAIIPILARSQRESPALTLASIGIGYLLARYWDQIDNWLERRNVKRIRRGGHLRVVGGSSARPTDKRFLN